MKIALIILAVIVVLLLVFLIMKKKSEPIATLKNEEVVIQEIPLTPKQKEEAKKIAKTNCLKKNLIPFIGQIEYIKCMQAVKANYGG
mgnify:CR=1 FL=1